MGSNSSRIARIITDIFIFLGIFILPWWFSLTLIFVLSFLLNPFYEGLAFGLAIDLLYSVPRELFFSLPVIFILCLFFFLLPKLLGRHLRI